MSNNEVQTASTLEVTMFQLLRQRNTLSIIVGQLFSLVGDKMYQIALMWLSYQMTNSSLVMGLVATATSIPALVFSVFSGVLADKLEKKKIMMIADFVRSIAALSIPVFYSFGSLSIPVLLVVAFVMGSMSQLFSPAYRSIIPLIVEKENLLKMNSILSSNEQIMGIAGPSLAALFIVFLPVVNIFYITATTYLISVMMLSLIRVMNQTIKSESLSFKKSIQEAFAYIRKNEAISLLILLGGMINFFLEGILTVIPPLYATKVLHIEGGAYGTLVSTMTVGMLVGAIGINLFKKMKRGMVFVLGFVGTGVAFVAIGVSSLTPIAYPLFFMFGFFMMLVNISFVTMLQEKTDHSRLGVVFSLVILMSAGLGPVSMSLTGFAAQFLSPSTFYLICGVMMVICGIVAYAKPAIRDIR